MSAGTTTTVFVLGAALAACGGSGTSAGSDQPGGNSATFDGPTEGADGDDPDDGLVVEGLKGRLESHQIEAGLKPHQGAMTRCYNAELKRNRFVGGKLALEVVVAPDGSVKTARISEADIGAWAVEQCLVEVARVMQFAEPKGGDREAVFTVPLDFTGGLGEVVWWDEEQIALVVDEKATELEGCADESGKPAPSQVDITLYVGDLGEVKSVGFAAAVDTDGAGHPLADEWADCAAEVVAAWTFPDPQGRVAKARFRYPR